VARDSAPVLEVKGRKIRANRDRPAPAIPAETGAMHAHELAVIDAGLEVTSLAERGVLQ